MTDRGRAVVAVLYEHGRFLWVKRGPAVPKPGYWMPPSGRIEAGETAEEALIREMREELGVVVRPIQRVWQCPTEAGDFDLDWWLTEIVSGEPRVADAENEDVRWVTPIEIHELTPVFESHLTFIDEVWPTLP